MRAWAATGVLGLVALVLYLNFLEKDYYPPALEAAPEPLAAGGPPWLPALLFHGCPACGACAHGLRIEESRILVTVTDHDGWYRLFWAGSETYRYDDPAYVRGALFNPSASAEGLWVIRGAYEPVAPPGLAHPCTAAPAGFELRYRFRHGTYPSAPEGVATDPSAVLGVPLRFRWMTSGLAGETLDGWWELENPHGFAGTSAHRCPGGARIIR